MNDITKITVADAFRHRAVNKSLGEGIAAGFSWIGYKAQKWSLRHEGQSKLFLDEKGFPSPFLDIVILAANPNQSRIYYEGAYSEGSANPPDCASTDGKKPDPGVPSPQSTLCSICPNSVWGSRGGGSRAQACQEHRRLAVLVMPWMFKGMLEKPLMKPIFLKVPPASLTPLKRFADSMDHRGIPLESVVTRITWEPNKLFQMKFDVTQSLTNQEAPLVLKLADGPEVKNIIGGKVEIYEEEQVLPAVEKAAPRKTGLLEAFEQQSGPIPGPAQEKPRGRPLGAKNKPKVVEPGIKEAAPMGMVNDGEPESPPAENAGDGESNFVVAGDDSGFSKRVTELMGGIGQKPKFGN